MDEENDLKLTDLTDEQSLAWSRSRVAELASLPPTVNPHAKREAETLLAFHAKKVRELEAKLGVPENAQLNNGQIQINER